jgi:hypothetical protein
VPVRIHIDEVPEGVKLVAGLTATVEIEPYLAPSAPGPAPGSGKLSQANPEASASLVADEATPQPAPAQAAGRASAQAAGHAPAQAASPQADRRPPPQAAQPQAAAAQASSPQSAPAPAAPVRGLGELPVTARPSAEASNAAATASADLKTLEEQIAANPPSGSASPTAANPGSGATAMPASEYLGQTFDLEGGQSVTPEPRRRSPDSLRRRAHSRWRRTSGQQ